MAATDPLIGKKLGDYTIVDILGKGGMARVYRGFDAKLERYAAVKVIDAHLIPETEQEEYQRRFQNEARAIARLQHSNIVGIYQFGQINTIYYMAMAFIEGHDLRWMLKNHAKSGSRMAYSEILRIIHDVGTALDYAHKEGVIHRDIKPSNIMVTPSGQAVLTDFGLALSVSEGTSGMTFGSAHYIAPEQALSSANAVPQSDLYSLGVVLYEMLAGQVPFNDPSSPMSVVLMHLNDQPRRPSELNPNVSEEIEAVVLKAMNKEANDRYTSGTEMALSLAGALALSGNSDVNYPLPLWDEKGTASRRLNTKSTSLKNEMTSPKPSAAIVLDDEPTVTDSKKSAQTRDEIMKAQQGSANRNYRLIGLAAVAVIAIVAAITFMIINNPNNNAITVSLNTDPATDGLSTTVSSALTATQENVLVMETPESRAPTTEPTTEPEITPTKRAPSSIIERPTLPKRATTVHPELEETTQVVAASPTLIETPVPTQRASQIPPTNTLSSPIPEPTTVINTNAPIMLYYGKDDLVLLNHSDQKVDVSGLAFIQIKPDGRKMEFTSRQWNQTGSDKLMLDVGDCLQVWRTEKSWMDIPDYCTSRHAYFQAGLNRLFWISDDPQTTFEVRRNDTVLATCTIADGECAVDLPQG